MPFYVFLGNDGPQGPQIRAEVRDLHRAHLRQLHERCVFVSGGPLLDEQDGSMCGSLLIFEADTANHVRKVLDSDPYAKSGLYRSTQLQMLNWTVGAPDHTAL